MDAARELLKEKKVSLVRVCWCGLNGIWKTKVLSTANFESLSEYGAALTVADPALPFTQDMIAAGSGLQSIGEVRLVPDWTSLQILPWCPSHARVMAFARTDFEHEWLLDSRTWLRSVLRRLEQEHGLSVKVGFEEEFVVLQGSDAQGWHPVDSSTYASVDSFDRASRLLNEIAEALEKQDIHVEMMHAESGAGQFEVVWKFRNGMAAADAHMVAKETICSLARRHNLKATFVPKLSPAAAGSGAHTHLSLWKDDATSLMASFGTPGQVDAASTPARFLAGIMHHLPSLLAFGCPTANSYARLIPSCWAGAFLAWGWQSREAPVRICNAQHGRPCSNFELKSSDGTANPYLWLGAVILSGMHGLKDESIALPDPSTDFSPAAGLKRLPETLNASLEALEKDEYLCEAMGKELITVYTSIKKAELEIKPKDILQILLERF